jgi:hypothetical protein
MLDISLIRHLACRKCDAAMPEIAAYDDQDGKQHLCPHRIHASKFDKNWQGSQVNEEIGQVKCSEFPKLSQVVTGSSKYYKFSGQKGKSYTEYLANAQDCQIVAP